MRWWINKDGVNTGEVFDDGIQSVGPGDAGFTRDKIDAHLNALGLGFSADYMGITDPPAEQVQ